MPEDIYKRRVCSVCVCVCVEIHRGALIGEQRARSRLVLDGKRQSRVLQCTWITDDGIRVDQSFTRSGGDASDSFISSAVRVRVQGCRRLQR